MGNYGGIGLLGFDPRRTYSSAEAEALGLLPNNGQVIEGQDGARLTLCRALSTITQYQFLVIDTSINGQDQFAVPVTTTNAGTGGGKLAVTQVSATASVGEYFFAHVAGRNIQGNVVISTGVNVPMFTTGTAGSLSSTTLSGFTYCHGVFAKSSAASASSPAVAMVEGNIINNNRAAI
ncbi:MAG: hypothetical protein V3W44_05300 [Dehalococcoidales bacterium]